MRILRLTNSNDFAGDVSDSDRSYRAVEAAMEAAFGEPVETIRKVIWPADDLPDIVERWVGEYRPDIVLLKPNSFWYAYESVPARVGRKLGWLGRAGQSVGDSGFRAARQPWLAYNPVFRKFRYIAQATIGGDTHLPVEYCLANMEAVIRRVLRHGDTVPVRRRSPGGGRSASPSRCRPVSGSPLLPRAPRPRLCRRSLTSRSRSMSGMARAGMRAT